MNHYRLYEYASYGIAGALAYCIPAGIYLQGNDRYSGLFLLYVGNFLFFALVSSAILLHNKKTANLESLGSLVSFGARITVITIIVSCLGAALFFLIRGRSVMLLQSPPVMGADPDKSLRYAVFFDASAINFFLGLFASLMISASIKHNRS